RCVPQNGHFSVTTRSSRRTIAPQPVQRTCVERPAMVPPAPRLSFEAYSSKSRSSTSSSAPGPSIAVSYPHYGHFRDRVRGSNSTFAPQRRHGKSFPCGGAFVNDGSFSTAGALGVGSGGGSSGIGVRGQKSEIRCQKSAEDRARKSQDTSRPADV